MPLKKQEKPPLVELITASDYKDRNVVKHYGNLTMVTAMNSGQPSITKWVQKHGDEKMIQGLAKLFIGTSLYFDKALIPAQAESIAAKVMADYEMSNLKLEDMVVICKEITETDFYGKDTLTPNKFLKTIKAYCDRRMTVAISESKNQSQEHKMYDGNMHERLHRTLKQTGKDKSKAVDRTRKHTRKFYK